MPLQDGFTDIVAYKKSVMAEIMGIARVGVGSDSDREDMHHFIVAEKLGVADQRLDQVLRLGAA